MEHFETVFCSAIRWAQKAVHELGFPCDYRYIATHELKHAPSLGSFIYTATYITPKDGVMHSIDVRLEVSVKDGPEHWTLLKRTVSEGEELLLDEA